MIEVLIESRPVKLTTRTGIEVRRTLPHAKLKTIGAWCFVDHFGPTTQTDGMVVAAHPHTGLQTVTWLLEGEIEHRDSIGSVQIIRPGELNLMTAGHGISHSELSLANSETLHAVQLWVALPKEALDIAPEFEHQANLPRFDSDNYSGTVLAGEFMGHKAPTKIFSEMVGVELRIPAWEDVILPIRTDFEYGVLAIQGSAKVSGNEVPTSSLFYLAPGSKSLEIKTENEPVTLMVLGGVPFPEKILMWWNFIGRSHEDVARAREEWNSRNPRFGQFEDKIGGWILAPDLPNVTLQPR